MKTRKLQLENCIIFFLFPAVLILTGCSSIKTNEKQTVTGMYFDTIIQIDAWGTDFGTLEECKNICDSYEKMLSATIADSEISQINSAHGTPVKVSKETLELIEKGIQYGELSGGKFDITIAAVSDLWDFTDNEKGAVPDTALLSEACPHVDYRNIQIDKKNSTVTLTDPAARLDLGGIAKGYIADRLKEYLKNEEVGHALINLGGNTLALGNKPDGSAFQIGIQKPFSEMNEPITDIPITDRSVVTSGIYQRYFEKDGKIYHHILNPETGMPVENDLLQVTIISDKSVDGDALSTCCYALGLNEGSALIRSLENVQAIFVTSDYELHYVGFSETGK